MKDTTREITVNGKTYKFTFNLNVMQEIQSKYGTFKKWSDLTEGKLSEDKETNIESLIFGIKAMLNEAIDIENDTLTEKLPFLTDKQVGRIITVLGIEEASKNLKQVVIDSTLDETKNV